MWKFQQLEREGVKGAIPTGIKDDVSVETGPRGKRPRVKEVNALRLRGKCQCSILKEAKRPKGQYSNLLIV